MVPFLSCYAILLLVWACFPPPLCHSFDYRRGNNEQGLWIGNLHCQGLSAHSLELSLVLLCILQQGDVALHLGIGQVAIRLLLFPVNIVTTSANALHPRGYNTRVRFFSLMIYSNARLQVE